MAQTESQNIFIWEGKNKQGAKVAGEITTTTMMVAKAELRQRGITTTKIRKKPKPLFGGTGAKKVKSADIAIFTRQMATMINAGIPIVQTIEILSRSVSNPTFRDILTNIKVDIESGTSFSESLRKHPEQFNDLFANLVSAGEQSGSLDNMLARIADYREKTESVKAKIKKALFYPTAVVAVAILITAGLLIFVVPQFAEIFRDFGADLPLATRVVMNLSEFFQSYWYLIFGAIGGAVYALIRAKKTSVTFSRKLDSLSLRLPIVGNILNKAAIARFARTLSTTFAAGLPLVDALTAVSGATGNAVFADATLKIRDEVSTGQQMQYALQNTALFPIMVTQMIAIGEESGSLEFMLAKVADFYEEEVDNAVANLSSLLEPLIMVILGVLIGGLVIAMYMPIFKLGGIV